MVVQPVPEAVAEARWLNMKNALIIFLRKPVKGRVKTRLAKSVGDDAALEIYRRLLHHTRSITGQLAADKFLFYADEAPDDEGWQAKALLPQQGADLGERMLNAFHQVLNLGYDKALIIGSDCLELDAAIVTKAFQQLNEADVVLGPAADGGYYLLGMKALHNTLFQQVNWSSSQVFDQTMQKIKQAALTCGLLPCLNDIDTAEDLPLAWRDVLPTQ